MQQERLKALCPRCGQFGFVSQRWVTSSYYPKFGSVAVFMKEGREARLAKDPNNPALLASLELSRSRVVGNKFRGRSKKHLIVVGQDEDGDNEGNEDDKKTLYKVTYGKYAPFYIGHYDKEKYKEQMDKYRQGMIKSRPNGRRWCKLPACFYKYRIVDSPDGKYMKFVKLSPRSITKIFM